jgi:hypothetical protein
MGLSSPDRLEIDLFAGKSAVPGEIETDLAKQI